MKKTIAIIVSILFVLSVAGLSFAAEQKAAPAPEKKEMKKEAAPAEKKTEKKAAPKTVSGEVAAVDAKAMTVTVKGKKGDVAITVDDKTKFEKGKTLADVKVGDKATVKYTEADGKNVAKSVTVKAAKKKAEKKEMKKEAAPAEKKEAPKKEAAPAEKKKTGGY